MSMQLPHTRLHTSFILHKAVGRSVFFTIVVAKVKVYNLINVKKKRYNYKITHQLFRFIRHSDIMYNKTP